MSMTDISQRVIIAAENVPKVYNAGYDKGYADGADAGGDTTEAYNEGFADGKKSEYDTFWDAFQDPTARSSYYYTFASNAWNRLTYNPKYPIVPNNNGGDTNGIAFAFWYNTWITDTKVPITAKFNAKRAFYNCYNLVTIPELIFDGVTDMSGTFSGCKKLQTLNCVGVLDINGLSLIDCTNLSHDSLMSAINCFAQTSTTLTATFGATNLAKLSDAEKAIATEKGWSLV